MQLYPSSLPRIDKRFNSFLFSLIIIFSVLIATYGLAYTLGLIRSISAEQTCPASLTNGTITGQVIITPDDVDGVVDCSNYDITVGSTGEVIFDRFVTDTDTLAGDWGVTLKVRSLNVQSGGKIHADGKGYLVTEQESPNGEGGSASGTTGGSGGAHGGAGGEGLEDGVNPAPTPGIPYGNQEIPSTLGSAGGNSGDGGQGGAGGGAVKIWATGEVRVDGSITANGQDGTLGVESSGGGGAGGSIWIRALDLAGSGLIEAKGGGSADTAHPGGGGGGGRVIVFCQETNNFSGSANANPGVTNLSQDGGIGSILGPTCLPNAPTTLKQFKSNGTTVIPSGGITTENTIIFASNLSDPDAIETLSLQIEFQPLGTAFTNVPTHTQATGFANPQACSSGTASDCGRITVTDITRSTEYHWQARVRDNRGGISEWVTFGANTEADRDVLVTGAASAITYFSGNNQVATVGTELTDPLVAKVTDAAGFPIPGYTVTWQVINGSGGGLFMDGATTATDSNGLASNRYKVGTIAGTNNNTMRAVAASLSGSPISFTATGAAGELDHFAVIAPQVAIVNQNFDTVTIYARDQYDNPITDYTGTPTLTAVEISPPYNELSGTLSPTTVNFSSQDTVTISNMTYNTAESIKIQVTDGGAIGRSNIIAVVISPGTCPDADGIIDTDQTWTADPSNEGIFDCSGTNIEITNNAILTLVSYDSGDTNYANDFGTTIIASNITVDSGAKVTADGTGYGRGRGIGYHVYGSAHGGYGAKYQGTPYGDVYSPQALGTGGSLYSDNGRNGGGAIKLITQQAFTLDGTITANGINSAGCHAGGATGGSIWIDTNEFMGTGTIATHGAKGECDGDGGAGGRIAIYYEVDNSSILNTLGTETPKVTAYGGAGGWDAADYGGSGTVYLEHKSVHNIHGGDLYIDNASHNSSSSALLEDTYLFNQINLKRYGHTSVLGNDSKLIIASNNSILGDTTSPDMTVKGTIVYNDASALILDGVDLGIAGDTVNIDDLLIGENLQAGLTLYANSWAHDNTRPYLFGNVIVGQKGTITMESYKNDDSNYNNDYGVTLIAQDLSVDNGGVITATGKGFKRGQGIGYADSGSAYGGYGARGGGTPYGDVYEPIDLGSGGGLSYDKGSSGGGAFTLNILNTLNLNGTLVTDALDSTGCHAGGATGGSIWIDTGVFLGNGTIRANGSRGQCDGDGGSGGRIAIYYSTDNSSILNTLGTATPKITANGGMGGWDSGDYGGPGTIYVEHKGIHPIKGGILYVDNANHNVSTAALLEGDYSFNQVILTKYGHTKILGDTSVLTINSGDGMTGDTTFPDLIVQGTINYTGSGTLNINGVDLGVNGDIVNVDDVLIGSSLQAGMTLFAKTWAHDNDTPYSFGNITVDTNGTLTLVSYSNGVASKEDDYGVTLNVTGDLDVKTGGAITADGTGYSDRVNAVSGASGGAYGGYALGSYTEPYGSVQEPIHLGAQGYTGDTNYNGLGSAGGGAIRLNVEGSFTLDGTLSSNGANKTNGCVHSTPTGAGSGGSILVYAEQINGVGLIKANGGTSCNSTGGSGGRIAVYYETEGTFDFTVQSQAFGQSVSGPGTVYIEQVGVDTPQQGTLIIDNNNQNTKSAGLVEGTYSFKKLQVSRYGHLTVMGVNSSLTILNEAGIEGDSTKPLISAQGLLVLPETIRVNQVTLDILGDLQGAENLTIGDGTQSAAVNLYAHTAKRAGAYSPDHNIYTFSSLTIENLGALTLVSYSNGVASKEDDYGVTLNVTGDLDVKTGGAITADGTGYSDRVNAVSGASGGAYGGYALGSYTEPYGSVQEPIHLGAQGYTGDTNYNGLGSAGGGAIKVEVTGEFNLDGTLSSNGQNKSNGCVHSTPTGAGAGGGILVYAEQINGVGLIKANGGTSCNNTGGSGGRIAVYYETEGTFDFKTQTQAFGQSVSGPGTVYTQNINDTHGDLRIDNNGLAGYTADFQATPLNFRNVYIGENVKIKVSPDKNNNQGTILNLSGDFTLESGALIDGIGKGFGSDEGPGTGEAGLGQSGGGGGAHGGSGGDGQSDGGNPTPRGGTFYGHQRVPLTLGSGGGRSGAGAFGGNGGGAFAVRARDGHVQINGTINMSGTNGLTASPGGGGGAGGSILIESSTCEIAGDLIASGGNGGNDTFDGGGGGGGRISILYTTGPCDILGTVTTAQGTSESAQTGQEGTYPGTLILPSKPAIRIQQKSDGQTEIPVGETTQEQTVILKASVYDPGATEIAPRTLTAEFEVAPQSESFTSGVLGTSIVASQPITFSGGNPVIAQAEVTDLTPGEGYKWQVRVKNTDAGVSSEWVDFGGNSQDDADFIVSTVEELKLETNKTQVKVGEILSLKVTSLNAQGEVDPSYTGTVRFTSTSNTAVLPASYSFTRESDQGVHEFKGETVFTETGTYTITVTDTVNETLTSTSAEIKVAAAETSMTPEEEQSCSENINQVKCQIEVLITGYSVTTEDSSAKICWSTNIETRGTVEYGIIEDGIAIYSQSTNMTDYGLEHCVDIASLQKKSAYAYQITATSHAGKQATRTGSFATTGGEIPDEFEVLVGIDNVEYSFNSNNQVILRFVTLTDARCSVNYGNDQTNLKFRVESSSTGTLHMVLLELSNLNGSDDLIYIINCSTIGEDEDRTFSKTGIIPVSKYFAYYPIDEKRDGSILDSVKELAKDDVPVILVTLSGITGLVSLLLYPRFILYAIGWLKDRKKSRNWGIVYDKQTREPVAFAVIRLYQKGELIHENISNMEGQFGFPIDKGEYTLVVEHPDYLKQEVNVSSSKTEMINEDVALTDRQRKAIKTTRGLKTNWRRISTFIFYIGFTISLIAVILYPAFYNLLIMLLYLVQITLLNLLKTNRGWGFVYNSGNSTRIQGAFVRLFDAKEGRQVKVQLTDPKGRYGFINEEGEYEIKVDKPGYTFPSTKENKEKLVEMETGEKLLKVDSDKAKTIDVAIAMDPTERSVTGPFGQ